MPEVQNYRDWRLAHPAGAGRLDDLVQELEAVRVHSVLLWGSVALGGYAPHRSDVDLLVVFDGALDPLKPELHRIVRRYRRRGFDLLIGSISDLTGPRPACLRSIRPVWRYELHALDLIQLRRYSVVVCGQDVRSLIPDLREGEEIAGILKHLVEVKIPGEVRKIREGGLQVLTCGSLSPVLEVMARCLYTLENGAITTKQEALKWAIARLRAQAGQTSLAALFRKALEYRTSGQGGDREAGTVEWCAEALSGYGTLVGRKDALKKGSLMPNDRRVITQVSLDLTTIREALEMAEGAVRAGIDWLEAGTPLILGEGLHAVKALRERFPSHPIVADLKTMDGAGLEAEMMLKAGANYVVVMSQAHWASVKEMIKAARDYGGWVMADVLNAPDKAVAAKQMEDLGADWIIVHTGFDERRYVQGLSPLYDLPPVLKAVSIPVQAVGGLSLSQAIETARMGARSVVIGAPLAIQADRFAAGDEFEAILREVVEKVRAIAP